MHFVCRTCLQTGTNYFNLFSHHYEGDKTLLEMLTDCVAIKVNEDDGLPFHICNNCKVKLKTAWEFKSLVIKSDLKLRSGGNGNALVKNEETAEKAQYSQSLMFLNGMLVVMSTPIMNVSEQLKDVTNSKLNIGELTQDNNESVNEDSKISEDATSEETPANEIDSKPSRKLVLDKFNKRGRQIAIPRAKTYCGICDKEMSLSYYRREHIRNHTAGFPCKICNKTFPSEYLFKSHQAVHRDQKHMCDICNEGFPTYYKLRRHRRLHKGELYPCDICEKSFMRKKVLEQHIEKHKIDKKEHNFICELCGKSFGALLNLKIHYGSHNTEKTIPCPKCGKLFSNRRKVTAHLIWHNTEHRYTCEYCKKGFKTAMSKKRHVLIHTGEKPHPCKICDKRFTDGGTLTRHMLTHTGETPYVCEKCPYKCKYKQQFDKHAKKHK